MLDRFSRWRRYFSQYCAECRHYGVAPLATAPKALDLFFLRRFSPKEVFLLGLLDPGLSAEMRKRQVSKAELLRVQERLNPSEALSLTEDKLKFYLHCSASGLKTATVFATTLKESKANADLMRLSTPEEWRRLFELHRQEDLVVKPVHGVHGADVRMVRWDGHLLREGSSILELKHLLAELDSRDWAGWLVQERLRPHRSLLDLSGTHALQTVRVVTVVNDRGLVHVPLAYFRIIVGEGSTDNFKFGHSGNLVATIDPTSGKFVDVLGPSPERFGLAAYGKHPATLHPFEGFQLPHWDGVIALVTAAAKAFQPLRTIGWDVAITSAGPALIEGNATWDPLPTSADLRKVAEELHALVPS
ncbi:MAG: hypothetical protein CL808_03390 [Citromicrobium sp.]|nr:hypothetical protein [Citromicrobium sp.]